MVDREEVLASIDYSLETGRSNPNPTVGSFWTYFHRPQDLVDEITAAGFDDAHIVGVESFAWMLPDLGEIIDSSPAITRLLTQPRSIEDEPSVLGASAHLLVGAAKPAAGGHASTVS